MQAFLIEKSNLAFFHLAVVYSVITEIILLIITELLQTLDQGWF